MLTELPTGTVTFLFTDIEGSTRLLQEFGDGYADVLAEHRRVLREAWREHDGVEVDTQGDAFFVAFSRATDAVAAAAQAQSALAAGPVKVRIGLHTGEPMRGGEGYVGFDVHRAARIAAAGHGGQVLLSQATADLAGSDVRDLGLHRLKDLSAPERIFQLGTDHFPPLKTLHETNLPVPATPFLGRQQEVDHIATLLRRPEVRLVTLTGPGGSGKTRLALQAAAAAADDYDHGVWWVPLSSLADHTLVDAAASQALGSEDVLAETVGDKRLLLPGLARLGLRFSTKRAERWCGTRPSSSRWARRQATNRHLGRNVARVRFPPHFGGQPNRAAFHSRQRRDHGRKLGVTGSSPIPPILKPPSRA
ncbi:MAG: adenylate/guanylate cyclase domain-containing protein [Gaiellaceae bacterium]